MTRKWIGIVAVILITFGSYVTLDYIFLKAKREKAERKFKVVRPA